jgi:hypothetical protein
MTGMRLAFLPLFLPLVVATTVGACSSKNADTATDGGEEASEFDGSTAACTSIGGTCAPTMAPGCPLSQQNPTLCGDVLLVCCLGDGGYTTEGDDGGSEGGATPPATDAAMSEDAAKPMDAAATGTMEASTEMDAAMTMDAAMAMDVSAPMEASTVIDSGSAMDASVVADASSHDAAGE